jgi:hypothetical protein
MGAADAAILERPLPSTPEAPVRERLRWEKELLGLYLSEHPMGEVADRVGDFVTAYSGDLKSDETLDGQRLVIGGIVVASRTVVTRARSTMAVVTLEDLQGSIEVVVFPKLYEQTVGTWTEGTILLVAGRVDHRGEEVSLLADLVTDWEGALARGPEAFGAEVAAGDRGRGPRRGPAGPSGGFGRNEFGSGNGNGHVPESAPIGVPVMAQPVPVMAGRDEIRPGVPRVSPLRAGTQPTDAGAAPVAVLPPIAPAEPIGTYGETTSDDEPALPDEARARAADAATAPTPPLDASPGAVLHVRFTGAAGTDRIVGAMEAFRGLLVERPGATRVILHLPAAGGGSALPMELRRGVAYDSELLAEVRRRLGEGIVELSLG